MARESSPFPPPSRRCRILTLASALDPAQRRNSTGPQHQTRTPPHPYRQRSRYPSGKGSTVIPVAIHVPVPIPVPIATLVILVLIRATILTGALAPAHARGTVQLYDVVHAWDVRPETDVPLVGGCECRSLRFLWQMV